MMMPNVDIAGEQYEVWLEFTNTRITFMARKSMYRLSFFFRQDVSVI